MVGEKNLAGPVEKQIILSLGLDAAESNGWDVGS